MARERQVAAYLRIADAALRAGRPEEAERWYRRALALDPANALALGGLAAARRQRWVRRWLFPAGVLVLALFLLASVLALGAHLLQGRAGLSAPPTAAPPPEASSVAPSGASALPPWPSDPEEALALAAHELAQGLLVEDFVRLDVAARSLLQVQRSWGEGAGEEARVAAARLTAALEACASRQWSAAAEHLAAVPDLPSEGQGALAVGWFLVLLRAGEADLARYVNSLFARPEPLRAAAGHYQVARTLLQDLPQEGDWAARLEHAPLRFFEDFGEPAALAQTWSGWREGTGTLEPAGILRWGGDEEGKALFSRTGENWRDYALIVRLQPQAAGKVGLAVRCADARRYCVAWLPVGPEAGSDGASWWLECHRGEEVNTFRPTAEGEGAGRCLAPGAWHVVAVTVAGDEVALTCDGLSLGLTGPLGGPPAGGVGLFAGGTEILVDYVAVTDPPALPRR